MTDRKTMNIRLKPKGSRLLVYALLVCGAVIFISPRLWMLSTALKPIEQTMSMPPQWIPTQTQVSIQGHTHVVSKVEKHDDQKASVVLKDQPGRHVLVNRDQLHHVIAPQWQNFSQAIQSMQEFPRYLANTLTLCVLTVIGTVCSSALTAYGFSRIKWAGRDKIFLIVLATMMIPFPVIMVPLYSLYKSLGWIGTLQPLWVGSFCAGAFNVFLLRQFFLGIPWEISESARLDGASEFRIFWQITLPLAKPALVVVGLFQFMGTWNDFLGPLIYLNDQKDFTLALGLQFFQSQSGGTQWHYLMAASLLVVLPIVVLFFCSQRSFIEGISMTGVKG